MDKMAASFEMDQKDQTLIRSSALPIALQTDRKVLLKGIVPNQYITALLCEIHLEFDLVKGVVSVGIVPELPFEGVDFVLGNDLAGTKVQACPVVSASPKTSPEVETLRVEFPGIFPFCATTRSQSKEAKDDLEASEKPDENGVWLSETFFSDLDGKSEGESESKSDEFSRATLIERQASDSDLKPLLGSAMSEEEVREVPEGYYVKSEILRSSG